VDQMAINGVNFGNDIVDDERYGMRRRRSTDATGPPEAALAQGIPTVI